MISGVLRDKTGGGGSWLPFALEMSAQCLLRCFAVVSQWSRLASPIPSTSGRRKCNAQALRDCYIARLACRRPTCHPSGRRAKVAADRRRPGSGSRINRRRQRPGASLYRFESHRVAASRSQRHLQVHGSIHRLFGDRSILGCRSASAASAKISARYLPGPRKDSGRSRSRAFQFVMLPRNHSLPLRRASVTYSPGWPLMAWSRPT